MTLQPSLIIWTAVCFGLLMLVLNKLLFKPMLAFMDARSEKIAAARTRAEELARGREEAAARLAAEKAESRRIAAENARREKEEFIASAEAELAVINAGCRRELEELAANGGADDGVAAALDENLKGFAAAYIEKLGS